MADHFVIDGSNLATEGRTEPSLAQLREAIGAFRGEHPDAMVTVVVDASFEHRIDPVERPAFSKAEIANEVVSPPAGAVGRGDGFLLQIANRTDATVVSNDSFQEFHAEYDWLFEPGRLIGGKPVPGVGWIFSLRRPVRGIVSRKTTQRAKKEAHAAEQVREAIAEATVDVMTSGTGSRRRRRGGAGRGRGVETTEAEPEAVNQPAPFLQFVIDHRLGTEVTGVVDAFASHGAFVVVDDVRCYVPLSAMGDPRPTRARDVLERGQERAFVVQAVDAPRRGIELALPGFALVAGAPSDETVAAEMKTRRPRKTTAGAPRPTAKTPPPRATAGKSATSPAPTKPTSKRATKKATATTAATKAVAKKTTKQTTKQSAKKSAGKTVAKQVTAPKPAIAKAKPTKSASARKATAAPAAVKKPVAKKTVAKPAPVAKSAAKKSAAKKSVAKKSAAKKSVAKQTAAKSTAKKTATKPTTATTKRGKR